MLAPSGSRHADPPEPTMHHSIPIPNTQGAAVGKAEACKVLHLEADGLSGLLRGPARRTQRLWVLSGPLHCTTT